MIDLLEGTGLGFLSSGQEITSDLINKINDEVNKISITLNTVLLSNVNINVENGNMSKNFTLDEAISLVPESRRVPGIKVRFNSEDGWKEVVFIGGNWSDLGSWKESLGDIIDGGEW